MNESTTNIAPTRGRWLIGSLVCLIIVNVHFLVMASEQAIRPTSWRFDAERNQVKIFRDDKGEPVDVFVNRPPSAFEFEGEVPAYAYYGIGNLVISTALLVLVLRRK